MTKLFDVVAVNFKSNHVRILSTSRDGENADAIVTMAVMRRGIEEEFFGVVPAGMYKDGDRWHGNGSQDNDTSDLDLSDTQHKAQARLQGELDYVLDRHRLSFSTRGSVSSVWGTCSCHGWELKTGKTTATRAVARLKHEHGIHILNTEFRK